MIGVISLGVAVISGILLRNDPIDMGLDPVGRPDPVRAAAQAATDNSPSVKGVVSALSMNPFPAKKSPHRWTMVHLGMIYACFGATYVVYATFIVTSLVDERGFGEGTAGTFWAAVGALSMFSGPLFGWLSDRMGRKITIIGVYLLFTLSYALAGATCLCRFCIRPSEFSGWPCGASPPSCLPRSGTIWVRPWPYGPLGSSHCSSGPDRLQARPWLGSWQMPSAVFLRLFFCARF